MQTTNPSFIKFMVCLLVMPRKMRSEFLELAEMKLKSDREREREMLAIFRSKSDDERIAILVELRKLSKEQ